MPSVTRRAVAILLALATRDVSAQGAVFTPEWRISGYFVNLLTRSRTLIGPVEGYVLDLSRLRLRLDAQPLEPVRVDVQYDNEVRLGSYLRTAQFALLNRAPDAAIDLDAEYTASRSVLGRHRLYRASMTWSAGSSDITIGRQRIAWGNGRFWSPLDVLNPFDATRIERDERDGIDALLVSRDLSALARWEGVAAPSTSRLPPIFATYLHWNAGGADYSLAGGRIRGQDVVGADFSGRAGGVGIRGEASVVRPRVGRSFAQLLIGADYGFPSTLTVSVEAYYNGAGAGDPSNYDVDGLLEGRVRSLARRYGALALTYDITPLLRAILYGVVNLDDRSRVLWPGLEYAATDNISAAVGVQAFLGASATEYGLLRDVLYFEAKWFF